MLVSIAAVLLAPSSAFTVAVLLALSIAFHCCCAPGSVDCFSALLLWGRWLRQMGEVQETPIISYMQSATADPVEQLQTLEQPQLSQAQMSQAQAQGGESEGSPDRGTGGYRLTFNTSPRCFSGTNAQVSSHVFC